MHPLMQQGAAEAYLAFEMFKDQLQSHGLSMGKRLASAKPAKAQELYEIGQRTTGRLVWGWLWHTDVGLVVKIVYQQNHDFIFVALLADHKQWTLDAQFSGPASLRVLRERLEDIDREHLDSIKAVEAVEIMVLTFKEMLLEKQATAH